MTKSKTMKVIIPDMVFQKIMHWVDKADFEVSGFGKIVRRKDGEFEVVSAYLLKQEGSAAETELDDTALGKLMYDTRNDAGELRWWWHSHVNMGVFWSGQDRKTITELGEQGWIVATVFNKKAEMRSALCFRTDSEFGTSTQLVDELTTEVPRYLDADMVAQWDKEFTDNVVQVDWTTKLYNPTYKSVYGEHLSPLALGDSDTPALSVEDDPGLLGYGVVDEAKVLGMTPSAYQQVLNTRDYKRITSLEDKLVYLELKGKFDNHKGKLYATN